MSLGRAAVLALASAALLLPWAALPAADKAAMREATFESAPHQLVQDTSKKLLALIEESRVYLQEDPERFFAAIEALLTPVVDFQGFARGVMSVHYRQASEAQRQRFARNFKAGLVRTYALTLTEFKDGEVAVLPPDGPPRNPKRQNVRMEIRTGGAAHPVVYAMVLGKDGAWRIGNIVIVGVNIGLNFRSQFRSAMTDQRFGGDLDQVIDAWAEVIAGKRPGIPGVQDGTADARSGAANPQSGAANPQSGRADPQSGRADPQSGKADPQSGRANSQSGRAGASSGMAGEQSRP